VRLLSQDARIFEARTRATLAGWHAQLPQSAVRASGHVERNPGLRIT